VAKHDHTSARVEPALSVQRRARLHSGDGRRKMLL